MLLCGTRRAETGPARRERSEPTPLGEECGVATADDRAEVPEAAAPGGTTSSGASRPARESVRERVAHLRERAERTRAGIEARRADSASIDTAFDAVERDAQSGGGVLAAAVAFRLFMFLVPYAFVMCTGFGLASTAAGQDPGDAARSAGIGGLPRVRHQYQHLVAVRPAGRPGPRRFRPRLDGPFVRPSPLHRPPSDLEGRTAAETQPVGSAHPHRNRDGALRYGRPDLVDRLAVDSAAVGRLPHDDRHLGRGVVPGLLVVAVGRLPL